MFSTLLLTSIALSGGALAGSPGLVADPGALASLHTAYGVYSDGSYAGMVLFDGAAATEGGAVLVVRYVMAGQKDSAWIEGVTVDANGVVNQVVHREGRRMRTLSVQDDGSIHDVVTDGGEKGQVLSDQVLSDVHPPLSSPWLVASLLATTPASAGDEWHGTLLDGAVRGTASASLTWRGRQSVGGGRKADIAALTPVDGPARTFVFTDQGVSAIALAGTTTQWVASSREELLKAAR